MPIPAGEFGFQLEINTIIHNLNDEAMNDPKLYLFLPDNFAWSSKPSNCEVKKICFKRNTSKCQKKKNN